MTANLTPLLRRVVFIGNPALGAAWAVLWRGA
jgi:hypothetical protein